MGTFRTKLDFSDNRQVKQRIETTTNLSGATTFGVPFGNLPTGPNPVLSSITQNISNVLGTFSGNSGTTFFTWTDSRFNLGDSTFSAITPTNSGDTQNSGNVFAPVPSSLFTIDGNSGYTQYSGVSFTMYPTTFIDLGGGAYSGELATYVSQIIDATGLDFSGRTIWNDVSGITRTDRLIISRNPQIGYTWTCIDSEGMGEWQYNGSSSGTTIWTAGTGANSAVLGGSNGIASGSTSVSEGVNTTAGGIASHAEGSGTTASGDYSHAEGYNNITIGKYSHAEGSNNISGWIGFANDSVVNGLITLNSSYGDVVSEFSGNQLIADNYILYYNTVTFSSATNTQILLNDTTINYSIIAVADLQNLYSSKANILIGDTNHSEGSDTKSLGWSSHAEGISTLASGDYGSHAEGIATLAQGYSSHAEGWFSAAIGDNSHAEGEATISNGRASHAEGMGSNASGFASHAEGGWFDVGTGIFYSGGSALGIGSHAEGVLTIAGGDVSHAEGFKTTADGDYSHAGGYSSRTDSNYSFLHSNQSVISSGENTYILGGKENYIESSDYSGILGGRYNLLGIAQPGFNANTENSFIGGGNSNIIYEATINSTILGGIENEIHKYSNNSAIVGGSNNEISGVSISSIILGGALNTIDTAKYSIIVGGTGNTVTKNTDNLTQPNYSGIFAGKNNKIIPRFGSGNNIVSGSYCAIVGGESNTISGHSHSFIGGGMNNLIECDAAFNAIVAGQDNINHAFNGVIIGGQSNILGVSTSCPSQAENSIILGGKLNKIASSSVKSAFNSSIIGGANNLIDNTVNDLKNTVIIGGEYITANTSNTVYVPNMIINTGGTQSKLGINTSLPQYVIDANGNNARVLLVDNYTGADAPFKGFALSANSTNAPQIAAATNSYLGGFGLSLGMGVLGDNSISTATSELLGTSGDTFLSSSQKTNNLNIINRSGGSGTNHIRMYAGVNSVSAASVPDFLIIGSGTTRGFVGISVNVPTQQLDISGNTRIRSIGSSASSGALHYTADGTLTTNTSDERLKTNITTLTGALNKVNQLRGVTYNWTENPNGDTRIGFIAQEVNSVVPELTFTNPNSSENYMGVHYDNITALLVEAVKELSSGITISNNTHLETQTILAEDNNIDLNFNGTQQTAIGGGLTVLHAKGQDQSANLITDVNGNFVTNNDFKPQALTIPLYTPTSSNDTTGSEGNITRDDNFLYIKTSSGWKRTNLENF